MWWYVVEVELRGGQSAWQRELAIYNVAADDSFAAAAAAARAARQRPTTAAGFVLAGLSVDRAGTAGEMPEGGLTA